MTDPRANALNLEKMALKYDMPMLAVIALEELQQHLKAVSPITKCRLAADDYWTYAERAAFWKHTGLLNACVEALAKPLSTQYDGFHGEALLMQPPAATHPLAGQNHGIVCAVVKAVNRAVAKKNGFAISSVPGFT